eukprot:CAMPEP_0117468030 /NCGR_PEP_ID=MMETSP0784-20121206/5964_1 /TAXON_ID=39447 /ORGANISM="" /LENGTH=630 /DNA_ID=CAMNT_0005262023 /DNA_START=53 /DNA_END=1942 /DNA_ORIENTATION=+
MASVVHLLHITPETIDSYVMSPEVLRKTGWTPEVARKKAEYFYEHHDVFEQFTEGRSAGMGGRQALEAKVAHLPDITQEMIDAYVLVPETLQKTGWTQEIARKKAEYFHDHHDAFLHFRDGSPNGLDARSAQTWTLKIEMDGDVRRQRNWPRDGEPSVASIRAATQGVFGLSDSATQALTFTLCGVDGDLCEARLQEALGDSKVLRLKATLLSEGAAAMPPQPEVSSESTAALEPESVAAQAAEMEYSWMWADAGRGLFGHGAAAWNTFCWSAWRNRTDTVMELLKCSEATNKSVKRPVELKTGRSGPQVVFNSVSDAVEHLLKETGSSCASGADVAPSSSEAAVGAAEPRSISTYLADAQAHGTERIDRAKPRLKEGLEHFKRQLTNDYQSAREDMHGAFALATRQGSIGSGDTAAGSDEQAGRSSSDLLQAGAGVAAVATGVVVAARLAPVRAARLVAQSVAAVVSPDAPAAAAPAEAAEEGDEQVAAEDFARLKNQVIQDYKTAHEDLKTAFGFCSKPNCVVPDIAGAVAGVTVASSLMPVRAARFAVARLAARGFPADGRMEAVAENEAVADQVVTDEMTADDGLLDDPSAASFSDEVAAVAALPEAPDEAQTELEAAGPLPGRSD